LKSKPHQLVESGQPPLHADLLICVNISMEKDLLLFDEAEETTEEVKPEKEEEETKEEEGEAKETSDGE